MLSFMAVARWNQVFHRDTWWEDETQQTNWNKSGSDSTRGKPFPSMRVVRQWSRLSREVVLSPFMKEVTWINPWASWADLRAGHAL